MKISILKVITLLSLTFLFSCKTTEKNPFWGNGKPYFESQQLFSDERFPNVVAALDGSIVTTWGNKNIRVRRSEDGGKTWQDPISVANPGFQGGGTTVDETNGDILLFVEEHHPEAPLRFFRSQDQGKSWKEEKVIIHPDEKGNVPSMHMNERGITLEHGAHKGRLIRPTRSYTGGNEREYWPEHYTNAIYSDDGGKTWYTSAPFPAMGTGEAAIAELSDGTIYYNSRRHLSTDGRDPKKRHIAWSYDSGETWEDLSVSETLPDGDQNRNYGLMGGLVRLPIADHDILIFSNIISPEGRTNGTVWASFDGGKSWPVKRTVDTGGFAYSSLAAGREGTPSEGLIYLFYEGGGPPINGGNIAIFNLPWITEGKDWKSFLPEK
ncbi:MAG: sialidase family protein [Cyclobacteriaceae bacterium]